MVMQNASTSFRCRRKVIVALRALVVLALVSACLYYEAQRYNSLSRSRPPPAAAAAAAARRQQPAAVPVSAESPPVLPAAQAARRHFDKATSDDNVLVPSPQLSSSSPPTSIPLNDSTGFLAEPPVHEHQPAGGSPVDEMAWLRSQEAKKKDEGYKKLLTKKDEEFQELLREKDMHQEFLTDKALFQPEPARDRFGNVVKRKSGPVHNQPEPKPKPEPKPRPESSLDSTGEINDTLAARARKWCLQCNSCTTVKSRAQVSTRVPPHVLHTKSR